MTTAFSARLGESCVQRSERPRLDNRIDLNGWRTSTAHLAETRQRLKTSATCFDVEVAPRQPGLPALPESWDARSLDDESISEELHKLKLRRGPFTPRTLSTRRIRSIRNNRLRFRAKSSAADASPKSRTALGVQEGEFLTAEQEARLVSIWQEWHRIQPVAPPMSGSVEEYRKAWAKAAGLTESELVRAENQGPLAAHLLLASVERLLYKIALRYTSMGSQVEDILAEARTLWLDAAAKCDPSKARLTSFGTMILKQRLPRILDRQRSLLDQPPSALHDELNVTRARRELQESLAREPTVAEIAAKAKMARATVKHVLERLKSTLSIDSPLSGADQRDDERTVGDTLAGSIETKSEGLTSYLRPEMEETLNYLMDKNLKNEEERLLCKQYYGFDDDKSRTLRELSEMHNCSLETVRKRLIKARVHLNKNGDVQKYLSPYLEEGGFREETLESPAQISNLSDSSRA